MLEKDKRMNDLYRDLFSNSPKEVCLDIPDDEVLAERKKLKTQCLCGFADTKNREALHLYIKLTSNDAGFCAEVKKSHNS